MGFSCSVWDFNSPTRDQMRVPCIARWILNHWTTREVPWLHLDVNSNLSSLAVFPFIDLLGNFSLFLFVMFRVGSKECLCEFWFDPSLAIWLWVLWSFQTSVSSFIKWDGSTYFIGLWEMRLFLLSALSNAWYAEIHVT